MHVAIDARLPYYRMGGISQYIVHLVSALADLDGAARYTVLHSRKDEVDHTPPAAHFRRRDLWTPCHHRWERWALGLELLALRPDVLHSPDFIPPAFGAKRYVITVHDLSFLYYPHHLTAESRRYYAGGIARAVARADGIAADSEHTRRDLIERLRVPPARVKTIYLAANPIYRERPAPETVSAALARYGLPREFLLFVGTLEPRKNLPTLLRAYARLRREEAVTAPLVLVGGRGWLDEAIFATLGELGLERAVRHLSGVPDADLACLYHAAALLALPSHYEGFGLPALEAMHCGCPVVASNAASLPEVVGDAGLLLDADDVDGWAGALARVLHDGAQRAAMVRAGRRQAGRFTWRKTAMATRDLYRAAARKEAPGSR